MKTNFIILLAGLCLATFLMGCSGNNNPTIPFDQLGNITFVSPQANDEFLPSIVTTAKWQINALIPITNQEISLVDETGKNTPLPVGGNLIEDPSGFFTFFWETPAEEGKYHLHVEVLGEGDNILITVGNSPGFLIQIPVDYGPVASLVVHPVETTINSNFELVIDACNVEGTIIATFGNDGSDYTLTINWGDGGGPTTFIDPIWEKGTARVQSPNDYTYPVAGMHTVYIQLQRDGLDMSGVTGQGIITVSPS